MKKVWVEPIIEVQEFVPNEYVAACGDSGTIYKFTCDAGHYPGMKNGYFGYVYLETNNKEGLQTKRSWEGRKRIPADDYLSGYHACGTTHEASSTDAFFNGYYVPYDGPNSGATIPVIVWRGPNNDNTHCTTNLDMSTWETTKS